MTPTAFTEDNLVQRATAEYLEQRLGWESVHAHNREDFGPDSLLGRRSDRDVVLMRRFRAALAAVEGEASHAGCAAHRHSRLPLG